MPDPSDVENGRDGSLSNLVRLEEDLMQAIKNESSAAAVERFCAMLLDVRNRIKIEIDHTAKD
jgi:hypothetical protein